jgi:DNA helicase HerA-like ATPase
LKSDATFLGLVQKVTGATITVEVGRGVASSSPIIDGRLYRVGQAGAFVRIPIGFLNVYGIVSSVSSAVAATVSAADPAAATRLLEVQLVGEAYASEPFQRGLSEYPAVDDEVHVVTTDDLSKIYRATSTGQLTIGSHSASESLPACLDLDRMVTRHAAIVGSTGSGKSNTVAALLKTIAGYPRARIVVIDPHGEYGAALEGMSRVFKIGAPKDPFLLPYWALSFDELAWFLVDRKSAQETPQDALLRDRILEARQAQAASAKATPTGTTLTADDITVDSPVPFDLREDIWYYFDRKERVTYNDMPRSQETLLVEGDARQLKPATFKPPGAGSSAPFKPQPPPFMGVYVNKILARLKDRRFDFLLAPGDYDGTNKDLDDLVRSWIDHEESITVLDLAGVPSEIIDLVVGLLSRILFETCFWGRYLAGVGRDRPLLMIFEEAHTYLPSGEGRFIQGYARRSVQRILKEGRKYGLGAVVVSQRPSELDETILSQCGTFIALRLTNGNDQARVKSTVPDELTGLTGLLPILRTGEALVLGEAMQIPSRIRVRLVEPRPDSGDPEVSDRWRAARTENAEYGAAVTMWRRQRTTSSET